MSQPTPAHLLSEAAAHGDLARVTGLLDALPDAHPESGSAPAIINARTGAGMRTALHAAATAGHAPIVALLLDRGADPNIRCDGDSATPLHFAAEGGHFDVIRLLIEHGADPIGQGDYHELDVIGWATCFGASRPDVVNYLLAHGAPHNIFSAVATGAIEAIRDLVARNPDDLNRRMDLTNRRRMPLHLAIVKQQPASLAALLDLGANLNALDEAGLTPLDQAALDAKSPAAMAMQMAQLLIDRGAEIRLPAALALRRAEDVDRWMRDEPDCLKPGHRYGTLIIRASEKSAAHVIETLLHYGASVNVEDDPKTAVDSTSRFTPLHAAAWHDNSDAAVVLLKNGANVSAREELYGGTPAGWAAHAGHHAVRDLILRGPIDLFDALDFDRTDRFADIVSRDAAALERPFGHYVTPRPRPDPWWPDAWCTPLASAIQRDKLDAARVLIALGANRHITSPDGRSLIDLAKDSSRDAVAALLTSTT